MKLLFQTKNKNIELSVQEAKELYLELKELFDKPILIPQFSVCTEKEKIGSPTTNPWVNPYPPNNPFTYSTTTKE